jgi:hypothetical protein
VLSLIFLTWRILWFAKLKKECISFLYNCIRNPSKFFLSFFSPSHLGSHREKRRCQVEYGRVYLHVGGRVFSSCPKLSSPLLNYWMSFFIIFAKIKNINRIWQTAGGAALSLSYSFNIDIDILIIVLYTFINGDTYLEYKSEFS